MRRTRLNPSPSGLRGPFEQPKRITRATRSKKLPPKADSPPAAPASVVASASTTAPDDEPESPNPPSSPLQRATRITRAMSRGLSRSISRSISPVFDGAKKAFNKTGTSITQHTTKSSSTRQPSTARPKKLQKKSEDAQPLGAISHHKRSHSQVSLASQASSDEAPRPSKKSKNTTALDPTELQDLDPTQTVFNTHVPKVTYNTFRPRDHQVAAPTEPVDDAEVDLSHFSRLDDGNQSTPRPLEQHTSVPTAEAEAALPSSFRRTTGFSSRLSPLKTMPTYLDGGFRYRKRYAGAEDEESFNADEVTVPNDTFKFNDKVRKAYSPRKRDASPRKMSAQQKRMAKLHPLINHPVLDVLYSSYRINPAILDTVTALANWVNANGLTPLPEPEKIEAMLDAHEAEFSTADASNHTREDVPRGTSSPLRDGPAISMAHSSPREMGVSTTSHHSSPSGSLASPNATTPTANSHIVPNETLETNTPSQPSTPTPPPTVGRARAALIGFQSIITSPFKRIFGQTPATAVANNSDDQFTLQFSPTIPPLGPPVTPSRHQKQRSQRSRDISRGGYEGQQERLRAKKRATVEDAEDESDDNLSNQTLAQAGQRVGSKRRYSGTYCCPSSPLSCDDTTLSVSQPKAPLPACLVHPGEYHQHPSTPSQREQLTNPFPSAPNPFKPSAEMEAAKKNFFHLRGILDANTITSRHWTCALAYRNDYWAQIRVIQCDMTDEERYWDDELRLGDYFLWLLKHNLYAHDMTRGNVWLHSKFRDDEHYKKLSTAEKSEFEAAKKAKTFSVPDNHPSDYEDIPKIVDAAQPAVTLAEPVESATVLQEIDRNQRPPPTPKPANADLPKTPYNLPNKPARPSNLRAVIAMSPPMEQGAAGKVQGVKEQVSNDKENMLITSKMSFKWSVGGEPEIRVMEDTKEDIPMDEWREGAAALLREEGMEPLPDAFW